MIKDKQESLEKLYNQYLQAKQHGNTDLMKKIALIILRIGGKVPKL